MKGGAARPSGGKGSVQADPAVAAFMLKLKHPLKKEVEAVRQIILGASPTIIEGIKWNAPSFRTSEFFATIHLRTTDRVQIVFHCGAKVNDKVIAPATIPDPKKLVRWLGKERCLVTVGSGAEIAAHKAALAAIVRAWIRQL